MNFSETKVILYTKGQSLPALDRCNINKVCEKDADNMDLTEKNCIHKETERCNKITP